MKELKIYNNINVTLNDISREIILRAAKILGYMPYDDIEYIRLDLLFRYIDELNERYLKLVKEFENNSKGSTGSI